MTRRQTARIVVDVRWEDGKWTVRLGDGPLLAFSGWRELKADAVEKAAKLADELTFYGAKSQMRIWTRQGRISSERTYPRETDPTRRKG